MAARSDHNLTGANNYYNSAMREHMFDKVVTPSDVGKLNRLVIPKQHAENYFPLDENQNGTVLDFEDRNGKMWRFRYSYWNSSQSYVMTKGWSRFVKDKKLDAGDTVSFHRSYVADGNEPERRRKVMFIDWRHRSETNLLQHHYPIFSSFSADNYYPMMTEYSMPQYRIFPTEVLGFGYGSVTNGGGRYYTADVRNLTSEARRPSPLDLGRSEPLVFDSYPVFPAARVNSSAPRQVPEGASTTKKLRLFGVDMEESSSSGETHGEMSSKGTSFSPVVIRDDDGSYWKSPRGEMGASSSSSWVMQLSDEEEYKRKGKSIYNK